MAREKDCIFISYAWEDSQFATWLSNMLLRSGYQVWIDRNRLLGGESFPKEIEIAINEKSFRFLALMSANSLDKANPRRERMLAAKVIKKSLIQDFIIPIRVDSLSPDDYDFVTTDLIALDFTENWATGLQLLLRKLDSVKTPQSIEKGLSNLASLIEGGDKFKSKPETLTSNFLEIKNIPKQIHAYRFEDVPPVWKNLNEKRLYHGDSEFWTFVDKITLDERIINPAKSLDWKSSPPSDGIIARNVAVNLIRSEMEYYCRGRGLKDDEKMLYFPMGLLAKDKIPYKTLSGRQSGIQYTGVRTSHYRNDEKVQFRYFTGLTFNCLLDRFSIPYLRIGLKIKVTDLSGRKFKPKMALGRRKKAIRGWYNSQWVSRFCAISQWLTQDKELVLVNTASGDLVLGAKLQTFEIPVGIDDKKIAEKPVQDPFDDVSDLDAGEDQ